ncbi:MAG: WYL domain-containing protein [Gemmatimonadetes bacterium]|nr:WYL domain-containing protein [Gemmatimonadota bacterium]
MTEPTAARLDRILYILPLAARAGGVTLAELAGALGCTAGDVLRDLEEVTARAFYHSAGAGEQFQIFVEGDRVEVYTRTEFQQPARLTAREGLALSLGLRILAAEAPAGERARIFALAQRLEAALVSTLDLGEPTPERPAAVMDARPFLSRSSAGVRLPGDGAVTGEPAMPFMRASLLSLDVGEDGFRSELADAAAQRQHCRILYLRPGAAAPAWRTIAPHVLVHASGAWYVLAQDAERAAPRAYRMDRMLSVEVLSDRFDAVAFDAAEFLGSTAGVYRPPAEETAVTVHYSARIARWIEQWFDCDRQSDGSVRVTHRVADPHWITRHVLQYGGDARVVEPASIRDRVAAAATQLTA